jgi:tetratricopeptide (TPR) repeat protein
MKKQSTPFDEIITDTANSQDQNDKRLRTYAINNKAMSLANFDHTKEAMQEINQLMPTKEAFILDTKATILLKQGHDNEAKDILRMAEELSYQDKYVSYHLGNAYSKLGKSRLAIGYYRDAIDIDQAFAEAHNDLAAELAKSERYEEARKELKEALHSNPQLVTAHENLIKISLRHHITPTFWDFWTGTTSRKYAGSVIFIIAVFLITYPLMSSLISSLIPDTSDPNTNTQTSNMSSGDDEPNTGQVISLPLIGSAILIIILLAPTIKTAKVGGLEFSFLDSQRSVQPLSNI